MSFLIEDSALGPLMIKDVSSSFYVRKIHALEWRWGEAGENVNTDNKKTQWSYLSG